MSQGGRPGAGIPAPDVYGPTGLALLVGGAVVAGLIFFVIAGLFGIRHNPAKGKRPHGFHGLAAAQRDRLTFLDRDLLIAFRAFVSSFAHDPSALMLFVSEIRLR